MDLEIDDVEIREFVADVSDVPAKYLRGIPPVIKKAAQNIKTQQQEEISASTYFGGAKISYDITDGGMGAEIGPEKRGQGNLAVLAYWGGANGGGGTVADPQDALDAEAPNLEKFLGDVAEGWF